MPLQKQSDISRHVWETKYRYCDGEAVHDHNLSDTWKRVAQALASVEVRDKDIWKQRFFEILQDFHFIPGGRILAGAGTRHHVTLFNCFVMNLIDDSIEGIFDALKQGALTMQQGGGVGYDFTTLRPRGMRTRRIGNLASGPVSFMKVWDSMCAALLSTRPRRGAMMATLRCDHPDIEEFIAAKRDPAQLRHFNLSVLLTDDFLAAVRAKKPWPLVFPTESLASDSGTTELVRSWPGYQVPISCRVLKTVPADVLWEQLMHSAYDCAEPGVLFIDRINRRNNLWYRESISATNPCGEIPLPPSGACDLGSINLTRFVRDPFSNEASVDMEALRSVTGIAVRLLDNVINASRFPLSDQQEQAHGSRRIGLGITGLADTLIMLGQHYESESARRQAAAVMECICHEAYRSSIKLAEEKGSFPYFNREKYLEGEFIQSLPKDIQEGIAQHGIRNSHLTAIAPTGTISLLADNISSGLEPVYAFTLNRQVREPDGTRVPYQLTDYAWQLWQESKTSQSRPASFVDVSQVSPEAQLEMEAALQPYVDNAISKTVTIPTDFPYEHFRLLYEKADSLNLKGCTVFRPNPITGSILEAKDSEIPTARCCL